MLYLLLSAEFVAAAQVLVYAGAVMVMFLFVIAYLGGHADAPWAERLEVADVVRPSSPPARSWSRSIFVIAAKADGHLSNAAEDRRARSAARPTSAGCS